MQTALHTVLGLVTAQVPSTATVCEDSPQGIVVYASPSAINTAFSTVLAQLGATGVQGLEALADADGSVDMCVDFVYKGHELYLTTCYTD